MSVKIRKLKRKDRRTVTKMVEKFATKAGQNQILQAMVSDTSTTGDSETEGMGQSYAAFGAEMFRTLSTALEDDFSAWLADLAGVTPEEFDEMDVDVEVDIISQLVDAEEFGRFFTKASRLASKIKKLGGRLKG